MGPAPRTLEERFWEKVDQTYPSGCWPWIASKYPNGYGQFKVAGPDRTSWRTVIAHRQAYELMVGPIPDGLTLDHLCRNRACVNPAHLEAVTFAVNRSRGISHFKALTACQRGHEFEANYRGNPNRRWCRTCNNDNYRRRSALKRAVANP